MSFNNKGVIKIDEVRNREIGGENPGKLKNSKVKEEVNTQSLV